MRKLAQLNINASLVNWIGSYLVDRSQVVKVESFLSNEFGTPSGVPQGSHLGPALFNVFINDISLSVQHAKFIMFADDLKLYLPIISLNDTYLLQSDLQRIGQWCSDNEMSLNSDKCYVMRFYRSKEIIDFDYSVNGKILAGKETIRDLGVLLDSKLSFAPHIEQITSESLKMLGFIKRCTYDFKNTHAIKVLYYSLVRSKLEYCSTVWSPQYDIHIDRIEKVQNKFARYLAFKSGIPTRNASISLIKNSLNITPLERRRNHSDLKFLYKLLNGSTQCDEMLNKFVLDQTHQVLNLRSNILFHIPFCRTNYLSNSPLVRLSRSANRYSSLLDFFNVNLRNFNHSLHEHVL